MKRKVGTVLEEELLWKAKQTAAREKKTLSHVLEEALQEHLARLERGGPPGAKARVKETAGVLKVPKKVLAAVLQEPGVSMSARRARYRPKRSGAISSARSTSGRGAE